MTPGVPRRHECLATDLDDGAHKREADHCGSVLAAEENVQMNSMVRLSMRQLCMTRKNATKEGVHSDRDKWLEAYSTGAIYIYIYIYLSLSIYIHTYIYIYI